jgi:hypothetical protein
VVINSKLKNQKKCYVSVVSDHSTDNFWITGTTAVCFHKDGRDSLATLRLKTYVNSGMKLSQQHLIINDGIQSKPTHLDGLRRFIALLTSATEIGAIGEKSVVIE